MEFQIPILYKNDEEIDGGSAYRLLHTYFVNANDYPAVFEAARVQLKETGEFAFSNGRDHYVIKMREVEGWLSND